MSQAFATVFAARFDPDFQAAVRAEGGEDNCSDFAVDVGAPSTAARQKLRSVVPEGTRGNADVWQVEFIGRHRAQAPPGRQRRSLWIPCEKAFRLELKVHTFIALHSLATWSLPIISRNGIQELIPGKM